MEYLKNIDKAKAKLMLEHPYFGTLASSLKLEESYDIKTFESNGEMLTYNRDYFDDLDIEEIEFTLANGAMHSVLKHQSRMGGRYIKLWQLATDFTINSMLVKNGLPLPYQANFQDRFENMYSEEIYEIIYSESSEDELSNDEVFNENIKSEEQTIKDSDSQDDFFEQLFVKMKNQGTLPKDLEYIVPKYFSNRVDWRDLLYRYISSYAKSSFSFMPPNKKYLYQGIYLPSLTSNLLRIVIAIDTSGSIDDSMLKIFLGEVESITQQYPNYEIDIITADSKIQSHKVFLSGEQLEYKITGRGGTDFTVAFDYIDNYIDYPTILLYFTDGYGTFPTNQPPYDVAWIMPKEVEVPFGDIIVLDS
jgi:predicted metal-dependent peptidase